MVDRDINWEVNSSFSGQASLANGVIYAIDAGALVARSEITGGLLWGWEVPSGSLRDTLILTDTHLFTQTDSAIYAVDLETHEDVWSYPATGHLALSDGVLYVSGSTGLITAIAIPEPTSVAMLIVGAGLITLRRRSRVNNMPRA